jgi:hypothetical protein
MLLFLTPMGHVVGAALALDVKAILIPPCIFY